MFDYAVTIHADENPGVAVTCDDLPEFNSAGDDVAHALRESIDGIETALSIYVDQRRAIPRASSPRPGQYVVRLPAVTLAKIELWNAMMSRGMRKADLCRLLGVRPIQGDRLVDFLHSSKIEPIEDALRFLAIEAPAPYKPVQFFYAPHKLADDFDKLRAWRYHRPSVSTEEANMITLNTLASAGAPKELLSALREVISQNFTHWAFPSVDLGEGRVAGGGILFNFSDMPKGMKPGKNWIEISAAELYKYDEAAYRSLLGLPNRPELND
jgi:antitoxin HicB